jgi:hypothetical protein
MNSTRSSISLSYSMFLFVCGVGEEVEKHNEKKWRVVLTPNFLTHLHICAFACLGLSVDRFIHSSFHYLFIYLFIKSLPYEHALKFNRTNSFLRKLKITDIMTDTKTNISSFQVLLKNFNT